MAEYIMEALKTEPATFQVHELSCQKVTSDETPRYLGSYGNPEAALTKAIGLHNGVSSCPDCIKS